MANKTIVQLPVATGINVSDIILLRQAGIDKQMSASGVCITTGQVQTISGVKTFASIPVGPASDPTTDNQLTRKKYVDDLDALKATLPLFGAGPPVSKPSFIGQKYIDTTAKRSYISTGTSSSADWDIMPFVHYGTTTVTATGGDVTVTLPQSWAGGMVVVFRTTTSTDYVDNVGEAIYLTTYDSLNDVEATFSANEVYAINSDDSQRARNKGNAVSGLPNAGTPLSITFDDDGANTVYIKYLVIA